MNKTTLYHLPLNIELETKPVLKALVGAHKALAELKGVANTIPNEQILITTLSLQEAKDSSEIENVITTHDELYQSNLFERQFTSIAAKEVHNYAAALRQAVEVVKEQGLLTTNTILQVQQGIEENNAGFRQQSGTTLKNEQTGEVIYTPPQHPDEIVALMTNLEQFMNDDTLCDWDALVKMAVIHHQFESIHPFYDGNGRTGRIINVLYLVKSGLLSIPILYLSRYINQNKSEYYRLLQTVRDAEAGSVADSIIDNEEYTQAWQAWVLFMLEGVEQTANDGVALIHEIKSQMLSYKHLFRSKLHKIYSQDLLNNIFRHPYTKIDFVMADLAVSRITATKYLDALVKNDLLVKIKLGRDNYYINVPLYDLLANVNKKSP